MTPIRMAQYGTKHGHAAGKLAAMLDNADVEVAGVFEPDVARRRELSSSDGPFKGVNWFESAAEILDDDSILAVASEGSNAESLMHTEAIVRAGKHVWYDKPAGDDWAHWQRVADLVRERDVYLQMGYMFRYQHAFRLVADMARNGELGDVFAMRAHMSTNLTYAQRKEISVHRGGILYDLAGHMLDQIVWTLGRPERVTSYMRNDATPDLPEFADNTLAVLEYERAMVMVDIAAMEPRPMARRYEVYGTTGTAIIPEPYEPAKHVRLTLIEPTAKYAAGEHVIDVGYQSRQDLYERELEAFVAVLQRRQAPDRGLDHESLVQETLLRAVGIHT